MLKVDSCELIEETRTMGRRGEMATVTTSKPARVVVTFIGDPAELMRLCDQCKRHMDDDSVLLPSLVKLATDDEGDDD